MIYASLAQINTNVHLQVLYLLTWKHLGSPFLCNHYLNFLIQSKLDSNILPAQ